MTISTIDAATPVDGDPAGLGAAQIRALKAAILAQFPGTGPDPFNIALTVGPRDLNLVASKAAQSDLDAAEALIDVNILAIASINASLSAFDSRIDAIEAAGYITATAAANAAWPIGSIFLAYDGNTPTSKALPGTWTLMADGSVLLGASAGFGSTGGTMNKTIAEANLPAHRHLTVVPIGQNNGPDPTANSSITRSDSRGGGDFGTSLSGNVAEPTVSRTSATGSGTALDITPAHIKVGIYRRTA